MGSADAKASVGRTVTAADRLRTGSGAVRPGNTVHIITWHWDKVEQIQGE